MHEILRETGAGMRILDLGSRGGSFHRDLCPAAFVVRLDIEPPAHVGSAENRVQADAARLPFQDHCFDIVIANHSLEHMLELALVLSEIGRVVQPSGALYVAVPDSSTLSDRLYRWVYHGGGHVNPFCSPEEIDALIRRFVPLERAGWRLLHTSFGFLEKSNFRPRPPRRMWLFGNGRFEAIALLSFVARVADRLLHTRLSVYGWALYYGRVPGGVETAEWTNVCVRCGAAHAAQDLRVQRLLPALTSYECPSCGARNLFTPDRSLPA